MLREASPTHIRNLNAHNTIQSFSRFEKLLRTFPSCGVVANPILLFCRHRMRPDVIYTKDLMIAVDLTPHLFSENLIANQERLGVLQ